MNENISTLGNRLRELRSSKRLTQRTVGLEIGLSMQAINDIEHDRRATTADKLILLADFFGVSIDYLVGRSDEPAQPYQMAPTLSTEESAHITVYRMLSDSNRKKLMDYMELLRSSQKND